MLNRRSFMTFVAAYAASQLAAAASDKKDNDKDDDDDDDVSPPEDLMREHGALSRMLLIYDYACLQISSENAFPLDALHDTATIVKTFIEDYHEKLEENYLFPRFKKADKHVDLVQVLFCQHEAGRIITGDVLNITKNKLLTEYDRQRLVEQLHSFVRMYRPHEAREDTVLFPALRSIVSDHEFDSIGEEFEKQEHKLFGKEGFFGVVDQIATIEKKLGIHDLAQFTPRLTPEVN